MQYTKKSVCFEKHVTEGTGDVLSGTEVHNVGSVNEYCIAAVGPATASDPNGLYRSHRTCRNLTIAYVGVAKGRVVTAAGEGIRGLLVTGLLFGLEEKTNVEGV